MKKHKKVVVFENTLQKTHEWLHEVQHKLGWADEQKAFIALRSVLQVLRDRLPYQVVVKFGAQLPILLRGVYYEGWKLSKPVKIKDRDGFLDAVQAKLFISDFDKSPSAVKNIVETIFGVLSKRMSVGEIVHIIKILPDSIINLWPIQMLISEI